MPVTGITEPANPIARMMCHSPGFKTKRVSLPKMAKKKRRTIKGMSMPIGT